jgi:cytochrome bd-type quinol oxidase subunit 1
MPLETLQLARGQFAMTAIFHILWPILTISLSAFLLVVEILWCAWLRSCGVASLDSEASCLF